MLADAVETGSSKSILAPVTELVHHMKVHAYTIQLKKPSCKIIIYLT